MREQLIQYVSLLFAGAEHCEDIHQEILQNTLDRYDDLIAEGHTPQDAYRNAIAGIGDINEILSGAREHVQYASPSQQVTWQDTPRKKYLRAAAIGLYVVAMIPLFILSELGLETLGLCLTIMVAAVATVMMVLSSASNHGAEHSRHSAELTPQEKLKKSISSMINGITLAIYLILSFSTGAWYITWVIFPISGAINGIAVAIMDLKEANNHA